MVSAAERIRTIRIATRTLRTQPVFTVTVVLSLGLAIALNTTLYAVFDALVRPRLAMEHPERLFLIGYYGDYHYRVDNARRDSLLTSRMRSYEAVTSLRTSQVSGTDALIERRGTSNFYEGDVSGVAENYFDVLGTKALAGRTFIPDDERAGTAALVISDELAKRLFPDGQSPIGARIDVNSNPAQVVGVVSHLANLPLQHDMAWSVAPIAPRGGMVRILRLRAGATRAQAEQELGLVSNKISVMAGEAPTANAFRFHAAANPDFQVRGFQWALAASVLSVLLVACANLANLQLARGLGRRRELALRSALGATRRRLVIHLLGESTVLALGGLIAGAVLSVWAGHALTAMIPPSMGQFVIRPQMSWRVAAIALAATITCLVLVGLAPAIHVSRADPSDLLKSGAGTGATRRNRRLYGVLVAVEIALALALACGASLEVHAALRVRDLRLGYDPGGLARGTLMVKRDSGSIVRYSEILQSMTARLHRIPGVAEGAAVAWKSAKGPVLTVGGEGGAREIPAPLFGATIVSPSYLRTYRLPIVRGRDFIDGTRDVAEVIVDEQSAHYLWPHEDAVGQQIKFGGMQSAEPYYRVVGVVGEQPGFESDPTLRTPGLKRIGTIYVAPGVTDTIVVTRLRGVPIQIVARASDNPAMLPVAVRRAAQSWGDVHANRIQSMEDALGVTDVLWRTRFLALVFTLFAALGVALAAFGVYGVVAHSAAERRREIGVRIALGASARDVLRAMLRESLVVALAGTAAGLLCTKYGVMLLKSVALEDDIYNAWLFALVALVLGATTVVAAMVPALRATRVDPTESLRNE